MSSAAVGGGYGPRAWVINAQVPLGYARTDLATHVDDLRNIAGLPASEGVGLLTGAYVERATTAREGGVHVVSTVGISEPEWAASRTPAHPASAPGTINIVAWLPVALSAGALVNAVITITEAKTQAMVEANMDGSGTATDAVCIACPGTGAVEPFAGPRSPWGQRLALATHATVRDGIAGARAASA
jgi:adenosylcobinamide amidohydrolase